MTYNITVHPAGTQRVFDQNRSLCSEDIKHPGKPWEGRFVAVIVPSSCPFKYIYIYIYHLVQFMLWYFFLFFIKKIRQKTLGQNFQNAANDLSQKQLEFSSWDKDSEQ